MGSMEWYVIFCEFYLVTPFPTSVSFVHIVYVKYYFLSSPAALTPSCINSVAIICGFQLLCTLQLWS